MTQESAPILKELIRATSLESLILKVCASRAQTFARAIRDEHAKSKNQELYEQAARANANDPDAVGIRKEHAIAERLRGHYRPEQVARIMRHAAGKLAIKPKPMEWVAEHDARYQMYHQQRTVETRRKARAMHLAYGFLRGRAYREMEAYSYEPPPWLAQTIIEYKKDGRTLHRSVLAPTDDDPIQQHIIAHSTEPPGTILQRYTAWIEAAGGWVHPDKGPRQQAKQHRAYLAQQKTRQAQTILDGALH